jgi:hypothetical protein
MSVHAIGHADRRAERSRCSCRPPCRARQDRTDRVPFAVQVSNPTTVSAMKELDDGKGQRFDSAEELFRDLGA